VTNAGPDMLNAGFAGDEVLTFCFKISAMSDVGSAQNYSPGSSLNQAFKNFIILRLDVTLTAK
jgi:hypothetical protein